jgi:hypothetical protein
MEENAKLRAENGRFEAYCKMQEQEINRVKAEHEVVVTKIEAEKME